MKFSLTSAAVLFAGIAASMPVASLQEAESGLQRRSNCTEYRSPDVGAVCIERPSDCSATYLVQAGDSCTSIAEFFGNFTLSIMHYWNPDLDSSCLSLQAFVPICINTPWYTFTPPVQEPAGTVEIAADQPATAQPYPINYGSISNCTKYEMAGDGVYEYQMVNSNGITDAEFYAWNTNVDPSNPSTEAGYWYCVGA